MKILYGVPGEGMGHATRSKVIIAHLIKNHDVRVVSSSRAYDFLNKHFPKKVYKIQGLNFVYKDGSVSKMQTLQQILRTGPHDLIENLDVFKRLRKVFTPEIVITDFETASFLYGKYQKIPIIDIDNIQVTYRCKINLPIPEEEKTNFKIANNIIKFRVPGCDYYLLSTFFYPEVIKENTSLIPPILRDEILQTKVQTQDHILVYQTSSSQKNLINILNAVHKETFIVYGFNKEQVADNCILKTFSEEGFINDLATSKGIITNGGYSLISEAVYLKKPICSYPIANQFEQFVNAFYIEKLNYGKHLKEFTADGIKAFIYDLDKFQESLKNYSQNGNDETFKQIDGLLKKYEPKPIA